MRHTHMGIHALQQQALYSVCRRYWCCWELGVCSVPGKTVAMATEEWVKRAIENSKTYEELPPRVRTVLPVAEWKAKYD